MKKLTVNLLNSAFLIFLVLFLTSCEDTIVPASQPLTFLLGCNGTDELQKGLYEYSVGGTPVFKTELYPYAFQSHLVDQNNGIVVFRSHITPENTSGIAYATTSDLANIQFAPIPGPPSDDYYYSIDNECPRVFEDGRIAYRVTLQTVNPYDDWKSGMIAIFNPSSGDIELSGDASPFVLSQPEQGSDTEGGSMGGSFVLSPDGNYAYCTVYGAGTDGGVYHEDFQFIVRYTIGQPGSYERLAQFGGSINTIAGGGIYLIINYNGLQKLNLSSSSEDLVQVDVYGHNFPNGAVSKSSDVIMKHWSEGIGLYDIGQQPVGWLRIIDSYKINDPSFNWVTDAQFSKNEDKIYFTGTTYYTNYGSGIALYSTPVIESNADPDSLSSFGLEYDTNMFIRIDK